MEDAKRVMKNLVSALRRQRNLPGLRKELSGLPSFEGADLSGFQGNFLDAGADYFIFRNANLTGAKIKELRLREADFSGADLKGAVFENCTFNRCSFVGADLSTATFKDCSWYCYRSHTSTRDSRPRWVSLFEGAKMPEQVYPFLGQEIIGYKKIRPPYGGHRLKSLLATLRIPADARRLKCLVSDGPKLRAEYAVVESITSFDGKHVFDKGYSTYDPNFWYRVGEVVSPNQYDPNIMEQCSNGIHFFLKKEDARRY